MMRHVFIAATLAAICMPGFVLDARGGENWPQWRGPDANGVSDSTNLPTTWNAETNENIVWKTSLPSWSGGTPIIWGDRIFVTSPTAPEAEAARFLPTEQLFAQRRRGRGGRRGGGGGGFGRRGAGRQPGGQVLTLICLDRTNGEVLWIEALDEGNRVHNKQNNSSPSPVTDGNRVWAVTGNGVVTSLDMEGNQLWQKNLQEMYGEFGHNWGYANSPLLYQGKLIVEVLHGMRTDDPSYLVAFDATSGEVIWHQERPTDARNESPDAYTTPAVVTHEGRDTIVITGGDYVTGHDPETGEEIWRAGGLNPRNAGNYRIVASPVTMDGIVYAPTRQRPLLAIRAGGSGDVTTSHLQWRYDQPGAPDVPTPICDGQYFYMVDDNGRVTCLDAKSGEIVYGPERTIDGTVSSSPLLADGKIYITNESAVTTVIAAGPRFERLATNELDGSYTLSSIAVAGDQLFLRTSDYLYCIGNTANP